MLAIMLPVVAVASSDFLYHHGSFFTLAGAGNFGNFNLPSFLATMMKSGDLFTGQTAKNLRA
jgi:hypothetical protein